MTRTVNPRYLRRTQVGAWFRVAVGTILLGIAVTIFVSEMAVAPAVMDRPPMCGNCTPGQEEP